MFLPCLNKVYDDDDEARNGDGRGGGGWGVGAMRNLNICSVHLQWNPALRPPR